MDSCWLFLVQNCARCLGEYWHDYLYATCPQIPCGWQCSYSVCEHWSSVCQHSQRPNWWGRCLSIQDLLEALNAMTKKGCPEYCLILLCLRFNAFPIVRLSLPSKDILQVTIQLGFILHAISRHIYRVGTFENFCFIDVVGVLHISCGWSTLCPLFPTNQVIITIYLLFIGI